MSWKSKSKGDELSSAEWNAHVQDQLDRLEKPDGFDSDIHVVLFTGEDFDGMGDSQFENLALVDVERIEALEAEIDTLKSKLVVADEFLCGSES